MVTDKQVREVVASMHNAWAGYTPREVQTLLEWARQELSRRTPPDDGPITAEWCREHGAEYIPSRRRWRWWAGDCNVCWDEVDGGVSIGGVCKPPITTRAQLLALLAALKGGAK